MSTLTVSNVSDGSLTIPTTYVTNGSAKAWVNFNGTGTIAPRDSLNVSSLTDNGTGDYTVNFTNAFGAADYSAPFAGSRSTSSGASAMANVTSLATGSFKVYVTDDTGTLRDAEQVHNVVFGDLA